MQSFRLNKLTLSIIFVLIFVLIVKFKPIIYSQLINCEKTLLDEYPEYTIVKSVKVGKFDVFLLKSDTGFLERYFYDGEYMGGLGLPDKEIEGLGVSEFSGGKGGCTFIVVCGENDNLKHTSYSIAVKDWNDDVSTSFRTDIKRQITNQRYVLDVYLFDTNYSLIHSECKFEDGTIF